MPDLLIEVYNFAYTDKDGNDIRGRATVIGEPEPINVMRVTRDTAKRLQISNFRCWRDCEPEPVIGE